LHLTNGRRILLSKEDLVKQELVRQLPRILDQFVTWPRNRLSFQNDGTLGHFWVSPISYTNSKAVALSEGLTNHVNTLGSNEVDKSEYNHVKEE